MAVINSTLDTRSDQYAKNRTDGRRNAPKVCSLPHGSRTTVIDPRDTRDVIAISLSACHNKTVQGTKEFGTWRM